MTAPANPRSQAAQVSPSRAANQAGAGLPSEPFATYRAPLQRAAELALGYLESLPERPVGASPETADQIREELARPLSDNGEDPETVVEALAAAADPGLTAMNGPRYFGFVVGGTLPAALAADWLTSAWDQNAAMHIPAPAAAAVEAVAASWLVDLLGFSPDMSVGFTTGATTANLTCLAAARNDVLRRAGWDV